MTDTLYFLFLDEIYSPNLNNFKKLNKSAIFSHLNHHHFGISGVVIPASYLYDLYTKSKRIKNRYFPKIYKLIFHYIDILHNREDYVELQSNSKKRRSFISSLQSLVVSSNFKYSCVFVDKHELIKKFGSNLFPKSPFIDYNLYFLCLRQLLIFFYGYLSDRKHKARGIIVAEARGKREDTELRDAFQKIYYNGISSIKPTDLRRIILDLFIVPKKQNYAGTQIADMVLYPTYDSQVLYHSSRNDHFIDFSKHLKNKLLGMKIIP